MLSVGLTGGIGAGKSTVADLLVERGAALVDADRIAREVVEPGRPAYEAIVERFGPGVLGPGGAIDRPALADVVFGDQAARRDLEAITHPAIAAEMAARRAALADRGGVVVLDIPLLVPAARDALALDVVVVVDCPVEVAVERLVGGRGFTRQDALARVAAQVSRAERVRGADVVLDNGGDRAALVAQVERLWEDLAARLADDGDG